ncbi:hypothetical protein SNE40_021968 [Patella caerulea]|uniref:Uncharacterized protein n=1 Tax=Patella caerulea TaxID=87958 RepID=A0AAN8GH04_PATCE
MQELVACSKSDIRSRDERLPASPNPMDQIRKTEEWVNSEFTPGPESSRMNTNPFTNTCNDFTPNPFILAEPETSKIRMNTNPFINNEFTPSSFVNYTTSSNPFLGVDIVEQKTERNVESNSQAVMMKLTLLHAMRPVKFCGDPADYTIFQERVRTHLEDGLLAESQKVEFLNKFIEG